MFELSFPGLGIEGWEINPVAFSLGEEKTVAWYGIVIAFGMLCAIAYAAFRCKQHGIKIDDLVDIAIFTIIFGVIGARAYYVIFDDDKSKYKTLSAILPMESMRESIHMLSPIASIVP